MWRGLRFLILGLALLALEHSGGQAEELSAAAAGSAEKARSGAVKAVADTSDSVYTLPPVRIQARRVPPEETLLVAPGQISLIAIEPFRVDVGHVAEALDRIPGLSIHHTGSVGHDASVSIRGAGSSQVRLYLDGVPLTRAGLGLTNLAELPFAGLDHIEVYRGFAPPGLPGSSPGGAIQLVTPRLESMAPRATQVLAAAGSFGTKRLGLRQELQLGHTWRGFFVVDALRSEGAFEFHDDNGTTLNGADDFTTMRHNNWVRSDEVLVKVGRSLDQGGRVEILHQWVGRAQGVPGYTSLQSLRAEQSSSHHLTNANLVLPSFWGGRLQGRGQIFHDWRRDEFRDEYSEIGLGYQDNRDLSESFGTHLAAVLRFPSPQRLALHFDARREAFLPWRRFPQEQLGPEQFRRTLETTLESAWQLQGGRVRLQAVLRLTHEEDHFSGDLRTAYSRGPALSEQRQYEEPRLGARLRLFPGVHIEGSYGEHHRSPGFLELFGDGGSVAGSTDLVAETGRNRDIGLDVERRVLGLRLRGEFVHYDNQVDHLITFLPQSQRAFVARNIGAAQLQGEEVQWWLGDGGKMPRWSIEGNYTRQRTEDLGVDRRWYAGKVLPGRPERQLYGRVSLRFGPVTLGYEYRSLGQNYLDRWNRDVVVQRNLHGADVGIQAHSLRLRLAGRNLGNDRAQDVAGFPVPGRTISLGSEIHF